MNVIETDIADAMSSDPVERRSVILLTGADGQVGWELRRTLATLGRVVACTRQQLDLADPDSICRAVRDAKPNLIVNAAAYTAVDQAEQEPELAMSVNGVAPGILAEEARVLAAGVVHYSTDYVYDGKSQRPYREDDDTHPINVYGRTKLAGQGSVIGSASSTIRSVRRPGPVCWPRRRLRCWHREQAASPSICASTRASSRQLRRLDVMVRFCPANSQPLFRWPACPGGGGGHLDQRLSDAGRAARLHGAGQCAHRRRVRNSPARMGAGVGSGPGRLIILLPALGIQGK